MSVVSTPDRADGYATHEEAAAAYMTQVGVLKLALTEIRDSLANVVERIKGGSEGALGALFLTAAANEAKAREVLARYENQHSGGQK